MNLKIAGEVIHFNPLFHVYFHKQFLEFQTEEKATFTIETRLTNHIPKQGKFIKKLPSTESVYEHDGEKIIIFEQDDHIIYRMMKMGKTYIIEIKDNCSYAADVEYSLSSRIFSHIVSSKNDLVFHASAIQIDNHAFLFVGPSGIGKTTISKRIINNHINASFINDDKPVVLVKENVVYAYGTPWAGQEGLASNVFLPVKAIYFLSQGELPMVKSMSDTEKVMLTLNHTYRLFNDYQIDDYLHTMDTIINYVPMYHFIASNTDQDFILIKKHIEER
jgi:hypothetical protein